MPQCPVAECDGKTYWACSTKRLSPDPVGDP